MSSRILVTSGFVALGVILAGCPKDFSYHPQDPHPDNEGFDATIQTSTPTVTLTPTPLRKRVFTTSGSYNGKFDHPTGGILIADQRCQESADAVLPSGLGGTWVALMSDSVNNAIDRIPGQGPWYRLDRMTQVFESRTGGANAITGIPMVPLDKDENGMTFGVNFTAWTGSDSGAIKAAGTSTTVFCDEWLGTGGSGMTGNVTSLTVSWIQGSMITCPGPYRLYCFEK